MFDVNRMVPLFIALPLQGSFPPGQDILGLPSPPGKVPWHYTVGFGIAVTTIIKHEFSADGWVCRLPALFRGMKDIHFYM
jgi:hypothetical protein